MFQFDNDSDSDKSVVDSINSYIDVYSSSMDCVSYKTPNFLTILNDEIKFKFMMTQNKYYQYIYKQVLFELKRFFYSRKHYKILYNLVLKEIKEKDLLFFGKSYKNFISLL
jgi:hypothetical protein